MVNRRMGVGATMLTTALLALTSTPAAAEPATTLSYPASTSATPLNGYAFDACAAPSLVTMQAWASSPYDGVGVYIGGANRTCSQPNLTAAWVTAVSLQGWRIIPIYVGYQAPCTRRLSAAEFTITTAGLLGTADAADAVWQAQALGMLPGSAIYGDMENYYTTDAACRTAVFDYASAWTKELHRLGYLSGMYANLSSGAKHLSEAYVSPAYARLDALWVARWDSNPTLAGWAGISNAQWANHQRGKQYRGDHDETYSGVTINIDSDRFDAPVATVSYPYQVTSSVGLNGRSGPTTSAPLVTRYAPAATVPVVCQTAGRKVGTTSVWNKLADGNYVTDNYLSTPSKTTYSAPLPRCTYPFQVTVPTLNRRTGPSSRYPISGTLSNGALGWVTCQRSGSTVGTTSVWDKLDDGTYATDFYLATPSKTTSSWPIPRC
ncbi:MAG TPA: glycoside hydrolase domain-containing protein [Propionibacteriaceae bacterium]|nr:glycoside hydrolase domain-containing protein [Propionibacteriaceae bacterium]